MEKERKEYSMLAIDKQLHKDVKAFCARNGITMISLVESLLKSCISRQYSMDLKKKEG